MLEYTESKLMPNTPVVVAPGGEGLGPFSHSIGADRLITGNDAILNQQRTLILHEWLFGENLTFKIVVSKTIKTPVRL
jgi:hypothetical protein